jgi:hypothetical protein
MSIFNVSFTSKDDLPTRRVHQLRQSIEVELIDNFTLLVRALRIFTPKLVNFNLQLLYKLLYDTLVHDNIIRRNASLARIRKLCPAYLLDSMLHISCLMDHRRALTTQLKHAVGQVFSSDLSDDLPNESTASEANHIQLLLVQFDSHIDTSLDAPNELLVKVLINQLLDDGRD